eukprot:4424165-Alexandrium_andersonii.AAC.1
MAWLMAHDCESPRFVDHQEDSLRGFFTLSQVQLGQGSGPCGQSKPRYVYEFVSPRHSPVHKSLARAA